MYAAGERNSENQNINEGSSFWVANGKVLFASNNGDNSVSVIDLETETVTTTVPVGNGAYGIQSVPYIPKIEGAAFTDIPKNSVGYSVVTTEELIKELSDKDFTLVNIHIPYQGEIQGTDANIAYNDMATLARQFPDKNSTIVVYCRSGSMSRSTSRELVGMGYKNILDLDGGTNAWLKSGGKLVQK